MIDFRDVARFRPQIHKLEFYFMQKKLINN